MQQARSARKNPISSHNTLLAIRREMRQLHEDFAPILKRLRARRKEMEANFTGAHLVGRMRVIHCSHTRTLAFGAAIGITISNVLSQLEGGNKALQRESNDLSQEILGLAEANAIYKPFGGMDMVVWLGAAWTGSTDDATRSRILALNTEYQKAVFGPDATVTDEELEWCMQEFSIS